MRRSITRAPVNWRWQQTPKSQIPCPQCSRTLTKEHSRDRHVRSQHVAKQMRCEFSGCTKTFKRSDKLREHTRNKHGEARGKEPGDTRRLRHERDVFGQQLGALDHHMESTYSGPVVTQYSDAKSGRLGSAILPTHCSSSQSRRTAQASTFYSRAQFMSFHAWPLKPWYSNRIHPDLRIPLSQKSQPDHSSAIRHKSLLISCVYERMPRSTKLNPSASM